jgi:hypothetical protein
VGTYVLPLAKRMLKKEIKKECKTKKKKRRKIPALKETKKEKSLLFANVTL